jgi:phospho-N-acetylmuramoyl-pentapeptide-transferase
MPWLRALRQPIRSTAPPTHAKKSGTPTAAGAVFIPLACTVALLAEPSNVTWMASAVTMLSCLAGLVDDWLTVSGPQRQRGLTPVQKLICQSLIGALLAVLAMSHLGQTWSATAAVHVAAGWAIMLPAPLYAALCAFTHVAETNAVNLTDGVDNLAGACTAVMLAAMATLPPTHDAGLGAFCSSMSAAVCGFMWHNRHPARVFMGDAGAQGLGAALASFAAFTGLHGILAQLSVLLILEVLSVVTQAAHRQWTRRRLGQAKDLLLLAPLHHHLELCGWHELQIASSAWVAQCVVVLIVSLLWRV